MEEKEEEKAKRKEIEKIIFFYGKASCATAALKKARKNGVAPFEANLHYLILNYTF